MGNRKKFFAVMHLGESRDAPAIRLCHSDPAIPPEQQGGGYVIPNKSVIWVRPDVAGGEWKPTEYRSKHKAMDDILGCRDVQAAIDLLTGYRHESK